MGSDLIFTFDILREKKKILEVFLNKKNYIFEKYIFDYIWFKGDRIKSISKLEKMQLNYSEFLIFSFKGKFEFSFTLSLTDEMYTLDIPYKFQQNNKELILELLEDFCKLLQPNAIYSASDSYDSIEEIRENIEPNKFDWFYEDKEGKLVDYNYKKDFERIVNKYKN